MILRGIKLENIRSYINEKIKFPEGSVLLSGDIGSGKSTILLAIEFAFFGILRSGLSGSSLLRHGCNEGSVELKFEIDKNEYLIKRSLKRNKSSVTQTSGYLLTNGRKYEGTPVELKAKIIEILGYPEELITKSKSLIYRFTVYTAQEQMKQILFEDKDDRLNTLRKIFGIDKYKTIKENSVLFIRELKRRNSDLNIKIETFDEFEKEVKEKKSQTTEINKKIEQTNKELEFLKIRTQSEKEKIKEFELRISEFNEIRKNIEVKNALITTKITTKENTTKKIIESKEKIKELNNKLVLYEKIHEILPEKELETKLNELREKQAKIIKEKSMFFERNSSAEKRINELNEEIKELTEKSKDVIVLKARLDDIKEKLEVKPKQEKLLEEMLKKDKKAILSLEKFRIKIEESKELIELMKTAEECPMCKQEVTESHKRTVIENETRNINQNKIVEEKANETLRKINSNIQKIKNNLDKLIFLEKNYNEGRQRLARFESSVEELVKKQKELSKLFEEKKLIEEKITEFKNQDSPEEHILKLKKELSNIRDQNLKYREKKNISDLIEREKKSLQLFELELNKIKQDIEKSTEELRLLKENSVEFKEVNEKYTKQKNVLDDAQEKQKSVEIRFAQLTQEKQSLNIQIENLEAKLKELGKLKIKIHEIKELQTWFETFFVKLMTTMEKHIMVSIHREFSSLLKEWFSILIEDIDIELEDDFSVKIIQDGYETSIDGLSGGEKTSVALAYRLSLNKVINDLIQEIKTKDFIILDEPTDGFSTEQLDRVRDVLEQLNMKQTLIVSHEPKMESFVENVIRIAKADNVSRVV